MADKIPVKAIFTGSDVTALGEYATGDTVPVAFGGTGANSASDARTNLGLVPGTNVASLDGSGKIPVSQIPDISIVDYLGSAANQTAMLALVGQKGDWCTRTDTGTNWIITGSDPTLLASWTQLAYPTAPVTSVAGKTGAVTLAKSDVGLGNVDNTSDANKPISTATQTALDGKQTLDADLTAIAALAGTSGLLKKTAANTWSLDTTAYTTNTGTVTSVAVTVPTGLSVSGSPITSSGTLAISLAAGYSIPTTSSQTNWDTAYTDRNNWDGGATGLTAATGRTSLGLGTAAVMTGPSGTIVGTTDTQTLTNKVITGLDETKTAPTISAGTLTLDCNSGNVFAVALNANITTLSFTNVPTSGTAYALTLSFTADGTARTVTWGASVKWPGGTAPTLTSTNAKVDTFVLTTWNGGTTWYAFVAGQNA